MSGDASNDPQWLKELEQELGLGDTPSPIDEEISLIDAVKRVEFTPEGWARVRDLILKADEHTDITMFHRILTDDADDAMMFTAMIALPYYLVKTLGYDDERCDKLITFVAASYVIAMQRGYVLGQEDSRMERRTRDE